MEDKIVNMNIDEIVSKLLILRNELQYIVNNGKPASRCLKDENSGMRPLRKVTIGDARNIAKNGVVTLNRVVLSLEEII